MKDRSLRTISRVALGAGLIFAGIGHLTFARKAFQAQVPDWVPLEKDETVVSSGIVEIAMGAALVFAPEQNQKTIGKVAAGLFTAVFPGNVAQYEHKRNAFGLNTDHKRFLRLFLQPVLVYWALASTGNLRPSRTSDTTNKG